MKSLLASAKSKTSRLIVKNLIILVVLVAVCSFSIWAWFTMGQTAYGKGINVASRADGVQVSWDGETFYDNLTALDESEIRDDVLGPAKNITGVKNTPKSLRLITGNGFDFFEPYLNRRIGETLKNSNGSWQGIEVNSNNYEGRYVDLELYFRGTSDRDVYLAGDSQVLPKSESERISDYGNFSKDNIAAASRIAFLNAEKTSCSFIWAPNANCELREYADGYNRFVTTETEDITTSGGSDGKLDGGAVKDDKTYYLWTFKDELIDTYAKGQNSNYLEARVFTYDSSIRYYVTEFSFYIPTYEQNNNPSIPIIINNSSQKSALSSNDSVNIAGYESLQGSHVDQHFFIANGEFNLDNNSIRCTNKMYADTAYIRSGEHITVKFGYNPTTDILTILKYESSGGGSFSLGGDEFEVTTTVTYYPLDNNANCAIVNPGSSTAVSTKATSISAVQFSDTNKNNILPLSITSYEQFKAIKTGDGYEATYKFLNTKTNKYLAIGTNGKVSLTTSTGSDFTLYYLEGFNGPVLKSGDYFLVIKNASLSAVTESNLNIENIATIYTGNSYEFLTTLTADNQPYQYYNFKTKQLTTLGSNSTPKLYTSTWNTGASVKVGDTKIAKLSKANATDEYYTAKIVMRIWVEGTDREAKTPLADGIFDMSLHFISG